MEEILRGTSISTLAPIFEAIDGARAGETVQFNGRELKVEAVS